MKGINSISGISLTTVEMRTVKGGIDKPKVCGNSCAIPGKSSYSCGKDAMGNCVCQGTDMNGVRVEASCSMIETS